MLLEGGVRGRRRGLQRGLMTSHLSDNVMMTQSTVRERFLRVQTNSNISVLITFLQRIIM